MLLDPKITVLMPVYNCELYIKEAVDSILNQTFSDFEFIIIDDASTDATVSIIKKIEDQRIQLIEKPKNSGYTNSLNYGLSIAKGEYIARMDGDDISLPKRFEKQIAFLDAHPDVVLCGSNFSIIGNNKIVYLPEKNEDIKLALLKGNCIAHPSVIFRNIRFEEFSFFYDVVKEPAEDYDFWVRLLSFGKLHNLQEVLLHYRVHNTQVSKKREAQQNKSALQTRLELFDYLNCKLEYSERLLLKKILNNDCFSYKELNLFFLLQNKLIKSNDIQFFERNGFENYLTSLKQNLLNNYFLRRIKYSPIIFYQYLLIRNKYNFTLKLVDKMKLLMKSAIYYGINKTL